MIAELLAESYTQTQIARWLGHKWPGLGLRFLVGRAEGVTLRTVLRLRGIHRRMIG